MAHIP
ncbi:hypothetical protein HKBW3S06_01078, partial [Candidatus Hakubella thermalkaliphila]